MPIHNADIADIFDEIADYLEIEGENPFRIRAYRNAARTIRGLGPKLKDMVDQKEDLTGLPGIGKELDGRIRSLPGFGQKTEKRILEAVEAYAGKERRNKLGDVQSYVDSLINYLKKVRGVNQVVVAGSYRRLKETVGDLDILVTAQKKSTVMDRFVAYYEVVDVLSRGTTRCIVNLRCGLQVDLRLVEPESFGAALQYFTGSQAHNIAIRRLGRQRGLKINEYGVFKSEERVAGETEESVYHAIGLSCISPELREDRGEIEACRENNLPHLVEFKDVKGDLHVHTRASDGRYNIREMALAAKKRGLLYIAITEHSDRLKIAGGIGPPRLLQQIGEIDKLNEELNGIAILKGIEVEILEDGRLDLSDEVLRKLDLVVGSVHNQFNLSLESQTNRILRAMDHPYFSILAHPTGRLINEREPYRVDLMQIIHQARERGCFLELNANPRRLDLYDTYCRIAKEEGVLVAINSDAHSVDSFDHLRYGVGQARRGWLEKDDVLNTRPLSELKKLLKKTMG